MAAILFRHDPVGINFEENADEYQPEVGTVLPRLKECHAPADVRQVLHQEFIRWFDPTSAGPEQRYEAPAVDIWEAWLRYTSRQDV